jgi:predicted acyl esterase
MFSINATPPDPELVGDKWRALWMRRLEESGFWLEEWHRRQRRDDFYKHGSVCEDYGAIQCPVYLVGGWADGYSNAIFRMMEHLQCPKKALIGPWAHKYPNFAEPGPRIGFLQESLRWWDKWLKGIETGVMEEPAVRAWIQDPVPPQRHYKERPGRWVAEDNWPIAGAKPIKLVLGAHVLTETADKSEGFLSICSPQTVGLAAGKWCPYGLEADGPGDQREEAGGSLVFDSAPFEEALDLLGAPVLHLDVAADRPNAFVAATLSEVLPDGSVTRLTYGVLNLTHRDGHVDVKLLEPGQRYRVKIRMNELGQRLGAGNRLRLALSSAYWPIVWPSPEPVTLTIATGVSHLDLPVRPERPQDAELTPFEPPENAPALRKTSLRQGTSVFTITSDLNAGTVEVYRLQDDGLTQVDAFNWTYGVRAERRYRIHPDDPLSATAETNWRKEYARDGFHIAVETQTAMSVTRTELVLTGKLIAREGDEVPFSREWSFRIPRDHL